MLIRSQDGKILIEATAIKVHKSPDNKYHLFASASGQILDQIIGTYSSEKIALEILNLIFYEASRKALTSTDLYRLEEIKYYEESCN